MLDALWVKIYDLVLAASMVASCVEWMRSGGAMVSVIFGLLTYICCAEFNHAGTHLQIFESPTLNLVCAYLFGIFHHIPSGWMRQHVVGHHVCTNEENDPDLHAPSGSHWHGIGWRQAEEHPSPRSRRSQILPITAMATFSFKLAQNPCVPTSDAGSR